jgi:HlyD family secretion protein
MVVYANQTDHHGRSEQPQIELGAAVRERQTILRLPDLSQMQVKINVHESRVEALGRALRQAKNGGEPLPTRIEIQGKQLQGRLESIANQPTPPDFRTGNIKQYSALVAIDGATAGLRPGMSAKCEIVLNARPDVLMVPISAIIEQQGEYVCWVVTEDGFDRRPLMVGITGTTRDQTTEPGNSAELVEAKDGVSEGELVVLNPRAMVPEARSMLEHIVPTKSVEIFTATPDAPAGSSAEAPAKDAE